MSNEKKSFREAVKVLPGKILGYADHLGVYNWMVASPDKEMPFEGLGQEKFELVRGGEENFMQFSFVARHLRWMMGEILTVVDASIANERQLKAAKDIIKKSFSAKISWLYEQCGCPEDEQDQLLMLGMNEEE